MESVAPLSRPTTRESGSRPGSRPATQERRRPGPRERPATTEELRGMRSRPTTRDRESRPLTQQERRQRRPSRASRPTTAAVADRLLGEIRTEFHPDSSPRLRWRVTPRPKPESQTKEWWSQRRTSTAGAVSELELGLLQHQAALQSEAETLSKQLHRGRKCSQRKLALAQRAVLPLSVLNGLPEHRQYTLQVAAGRALRCFDLQHSRVHRELQERAVHCWRGLVRAQRVEEAAQRRRVGALRRVLELSHLAAMRQSAARLRRWRWATRKFAAVERRARQAAAATVQRVWRGVLGRRAAAAWRVLVEAEFARKLALARRAAAFDLFLSAQRAEVAVLCHRARSAITAQRIIRGLLGRARFRDAWAAREQYRLEVRSCIVLQCAWRQYLARQVLAALKLHQLKIRMATEIQRIARGAAKRRWYPIYRAQMRALDAAVTRLQAQWRRKRGEWSSIHIRAMVMRAEAAKAMAQMLDDQYKSQVEELKLLRKRQMHAATLMQTLWKGYFSRLIFNRNKAQTALLIHGVTLLQGVWRRRRKEYSKHLRFLAFSLMGAEDAKAKRRFSAIRLRSQTIASIMLQRVARGFKGRLKARRRRAAVRLNEFAAIVFAHKTLRILRVRRLQRLRARRLIRDMLRVLVARRKYGSAVVVQRRIRGVLGRRVALRRRILVEREATAWLLTSWARHCLDRDTLHKRFEKRRLLMRISRRKIARFCQVRYRGGRDRARYRVIREAYISAKLRAEYLEARRVEKELKEKMEQRKKEEIQRRLANEKARRRSLERRAKEVEDAAQARRDEVLAAWVIMVDRDGAGYYFNTLLQVQRYSQPEGYELHGQEWRLANGPEGFYYYNPFTKGTTIVRPEGCTVDVCSQSCDKPSAVYCVECWEVYCQDDFVTAHGAGKRAQHTWLPIPDIADEEAWASEYTEEQRRLQRDAKFRPVLASAAYTPANEPEWDAWRPREG